MQLLGRKAIGRTRCPDARALLPSYVEGELDASDRERVAGHLKICSPCRIEEQQFRAALGALAVAQHVPSPGDLYAGFAARLDHIHRNGRHRAAQLRWAGAAAGLLLVCAVGASPLMRRIMLPVPEPAPGAVKPSVSPSAVITVKTPVNADRKVVSKAAPAIGKNEQEIVKPAPFDVEPAPSALRPRTERPMVAVGSFLDVKPAAGPTAREQFRRAASSGTRASSDEAVPVRPDRKSEFIADRIERIQVGDRITSVRTGYQLDEEGRRTVVDVNIGTSVVP